ncbi:MAG: aminotransferase class I/II-fold pyridoxal phosphate-dependent enzyme [Bacteroidota bacterium]
MGKSTQYTENTRLFQNGRRMILLDRNENQYGPAPACFEVLRRADLRQLSLYSRSYARGTKGELAERLSAAAGIPERRLLLSYGSEDMLKQAVHCFLAPGRTLLAPEQSWWYYKKLASEVGGEHRTYRLHAAGNRFTYDPEEIIALCRAHEPGIILIASPNNPTGNAIGEEHLARILASCPSSVVVLDEAYGGFVEAAEADLQRLFSMSGRLLVLRTFSKYYALAGLRIGYAMAGAELDRLISFSARYLGYHRLSEEIALAALESPDYYRDIARRMQEDKSAYATLFGRLNGFLRYESDANFILVRYPEEVRTVLSEGLTARGIAVKFLDDPGLENCMRITIGTHDQNASVMSALEEIAP